MWLGWPRREEKYNYKRGEMNSGRRCLPHGKKEYSRAQEQAD